jgi:hypothetical protein
MDLSFAKTPRFATSVLLTWLFEDEDENDTARMSGSSSLPDLSLSLVQHLECGSCSLLVQRKQARGVASF